MLITRQEFQEWWSDEATDSLALSESAAGDPAGPSPDQDPADWWFDKADADDSGDLDANEWQLLQLTHDQVAGEREPRVPEDGGAP